MTFRAAGAPGEGGRRRSTRSAGAASRSAWAPAGGRRSTRGHGFAFHDVDGRWQRLEEQVAIVHGLLTEERFTFHGAHYVLAGREFLPKTRPAAAAAADPRRERRSDRGCRRLIGRYADEFNTVGGTPEEVAQRFARARAGCEAAGRDPASLVTSLMTWFFIAPTEDDVPREAAARARARSHGRSVRRVPGRHRTRLHRRHARRGRSSGCAAYAAAGVQRIFLNHELYDDLEMLELVASGRAPGGGGVDDPALRSVPVRAPPGDRRDGACGSGRWSTASRCRTIRCIAAARN